MGRERSKVLKCDAFRWGGVEPAAYKEEGERFRSVTRHTLLGGREDEQGLNFVTRYFEVGPGGYSSLERHEHPHAVVILRGRGRVILGEEAHEVAPFDCVYVSPGTVHQFHAAEDEALGFLCVVDRERDRPQPVSAEEIEAPVGPPVRG